MLPGLSPQGALLDCMTKSVMQSGSPGFCDLLYGGPGADIMDGGGGDDTFYVDDPADYVRDLGGTNTDTVFTTVSYTLPLAWRSRTWPRGSLPRPTR
jgi:hypothetical protein